MFSLSHCISQFLFHKSEGDVHRVFDMQLTPGVTSQSVQTQ